MQPSRKYQGQPNKKQRHLYVVPSTTRTNTGDNHSFLEFCLYHITPQFRKISTKAFVCYSGLTLFALFFNVSNQYLYGFHGLTLWINMSLAVFTLLFGVPWILLAIPEAIYFNSCYTFVAAFILNVFLLHRYSLGDSDYLPFSLKSIYTAVQSLLTQRNTKLKSKTQTQSIKLATPKYKTSYNSSPNKKTKVNTQAKPKPILKNKLKKRPDPKKNPYIIKTKHHIIKLKKAIQSTFSRA
jgi:hypothetical protein